MIVERAGYICRGINFYLKSIYGRTQKLVFDENTKNRQQILLKLCYKQPTKTDWLITNCQMQ